MENAETMTCATCAVAQEFMDISEDFFGSLSTVLTDGMIDVYIAVACLWLSVSGIKILLGQTDLASAGKELFFVLLAGSLLVANKAGLVIKFYVMATGTMNAAAKTVLLAAQNASSQNWLSEVPDKYSDAAILVYVAEEGLFNILDVAWELWKSFSIGNMTGPLTAVLIIIPWMLLIVVYFAQVTVTLFRVGVIAGLAPWIILGVGFQWSKGMVWQGIKSLIAAGMVLYGATMAIGICLFTVVQLDEVHDFTAASMSGGTFFTSSGFLAVILGVMGTVFVTEATAVANSIAESQFTNTAAATMAGAALGAAATLGKKFAPPGAKAALAFADKATGAIQSGIGSAQDAYANNSDILGSAKRSLGGDIRDLSRGNHTKNFDDYLDSLRRGGISRN